MKDFTNKQNFDPESLLTFLAVMLSCTELRQLRSAGHVCITITSSSAGVPVLGVGLEGHGGDL